jgi:hypothetical protein
MGPAHRSRFRGRALLRSADRTLAPATCSVVKSGRVSSMVIVVDDESRRSAVADARPFDPALFRDAAIDPDTANPNA